MMLTALHNAIMALPHSGARGFEGFVADLLSEVTGQNFSTQKSGSQNGTDALASTFKIGLEGKRYRESTPLATDLLKAKLVEAATTNPELELWILATTRSIDPLDIRAIKELAASYGMEALVLAWEAGAFRTPPLGLLCAMAPGAVTAHLGSDPTINAELAAIVQDPNFTSQSENLAQDLKAADVGYAAARVTLTQWNRAQMTDAQCARLAFDSEASVLANGNRRIGRPTISKAIEAWWSTTSPAAILLGEEGMGKTWAALGWWSDHADKPTRPLCVIIPARDVNAEDGPRLVAEALFKATKLRDVVFWEKRLERWLANSVGGTRLVVIIDGLNQKWAFTRWSQLLMSLTAGAWRDCARILLTCRPDHWNGKLRALADLQPNPTPISVARFDDDELNTLLRSYDLRKEWDPAIKELIRVPRLCHVAVRRHDDLAATGDVTVERLIYEDWRHRSASARAAWSEAEFHAFIIDLASRLRATAFDDAQTRAELIAALTRSSGTETTDAPPILSEIIDGGWMESAGKPHELRVRKARVPPVLGLALLHELSSTKDQDGADSIMAVALEAYQGNDISVAILRYAATFSLIDADTPDSVRIALIKRWLGAQNFSGQDFAALWPLVGAKPEIMLDCVEQIWFGANPHGREDEVIFKSFSNANQWPIVASSLEARMTDWLSRYWLDPFVGAVIGRVEDDEAAQHRRKATTARAEAWHAVGGPAATGVTPVLTSDASWGRARATELLSWLPRANFIRPIKAWAITTAILGPPTPLHRMAWSLRWNDTDCVETEALILDVANTFFDHGHAVSCDAAVKLLEALATPKSMDVFASRSSSIGLIKSPSKHAVSVHEGTILWDHQAAMQWSSVQDQPLNALRGLEPLASDTRLKLAEGDVTILRVIAQRVCDKDVWDLDGGEVICRHSQELPLARWAAPELTVLLRRKFQFPTPTKPLTCESLARSRSRGWLARLLDWVTSTPTPVAIEAKAGQPASFETNSHASKLAVALPTVAVLLDEAELAPWREFARMQRVSFSEDRDLIPELHSVSLVNLSSREQVEILLEWPFGPPFAEIFAQVLEPLSAAEFDAITTRLDPCAPERQLENWLLLLSEIDLSAMPNGWPPITALFAHRTARIRGLAMLVARNAQDLAMADHLEASGWACAVTTNPRDVGDEGAYGSLLLARSKRAAADPTIASRVHGEVLGDLADNYPQQPVYLDRFASYVEAELHYLLEAKSTSYPRGLLEPVGGWKAFAARDPDRLKLALKPLIDNKAKRLSFFMMDKFPVYDAIDALATIDAATASKLITRELEQQLSGSMRSGDLFAAAMRLPGPDGNAARDLLLSDAIDDYRLQRLVNSAARHNQLQWLNSHISSGLTSNSAAFIARGMVLASFLPDSDEAGRLWTGVLAAPPGAGWLAQVHATSSKRFDRQRTARTWFNAFAAARDSETVYAALRLFVAVVDSRVYDSNKLRPDGKDLANWPATKRAHWRWSWEAIKAAVKRDEDELKKTLLFSSPPGRSQYPRLR